MRETLVGGKVAQPFVCNSVTGNWPPPEHPLYGDPALVDEVTDWLLAQGRSVFQLWLLDPDERQHSVEVLRRLHVPHEARVLSLGCGVGGMERYWAEARPDIHVTLVNASKGQLDRCLCPGARVLADMRDRASLPGSDYDVVLMAYSLHHCDDVLGMVDTARSMLRPGGTLVVLDVVDGSRRFNTAMQYRSPKSVELQAAGLVRMDYGLTWHRLPDALLGESVSAVINADACRPSLWLGMA